MGKHILVISQYFYPEQFRINDICTEWVKKGYKVTVLTGIPNYPHGKFYKGYGLRKKRREKINGIDILRIPLIPRGNNSIMLALNYFSFVVTGFFWQLLSKLKADYVFIFEVSPMTQALPGVWYAKKNKIPCYLYVQDLWPENVEVVTGIKNNYIIGSIGKMVDYIYKNCDKIFTTSESFVKAIVKRGVNEARVENWPQYAESFYEPIKEANKTEIPHDGRFNIVFTGNIGQAQGLDLLPRVASILKSEGYGNMICFNIIGDGRFRETLKEIIYQNKVDDMFNFIDRQPPEEIPYYISSCDAAFLSFANKELFNMTIPAKLQSYLACGIPIVASAGGESKKLINTSQAGFCTETGNENKLVNSIVKLMHLTENERNLMGERARLYYEENFDKDYLLNKMDKFFQ
ncbi:glycosyltransferase family 4 protein [Virgibacillus ihumii]|uniref:glycosyltransferase family 4 protein n=1 Tax=Virgibacillus ihumii TaxID=2686091 RepID=UPI00157E06A8|nr:glycosyltransferase family 4 protein [Virgibacillus ihumii]